LRKNFKNIASKFGFEYKPKPLETDIPNIKEKFNEFSKKTLSSLRET
jgi:hypothetical protein